MSRRPRSMDTSRFLPRSEGRAVGKRWMPYLIGSPIKRQHIILRPKGATVEWVQLDDLEGRCIVARANRTEGGKLVRQKGHNLPGNFRRLPWASGMMTGRGV